MTWHLKSVRAGCRDSQSAGLAIGMARDFRFALRLLARSPAFAAVAVLMLALGIGSVTAMLSIVRALVLHPFSSPNAERLVILWSSDNATVSTLDYFDIRDQAASFAELSAYSLQRINVGGA